MEVKNIILNTAKLLNMSDLITYLDDMQHVVPSADTLKDIEDMILAVNITNSNIACNYIELTSTKRVHSDSGVVVYNYLSNKNIIEIKSVKDLNGNKVKYTVRPDNLLIPKGSHDIEFSYYPASVGLADNINYYLKINEIIFALGVAGEYLFIKGDIDDAYMWDKRFKQMMLGALRPKRQIDMPVDRWC